MKTTTRSKKLVKRQSLATPITTDLAGVPVNVTRAVGAKLITERFFPVSPRTLETWPLPTRRVNNKAVYATADLLAYAAARLAAAPITKGGGRRRTAA